MAPLPSKHVHNGVKTILGAIGKQFTLSDDKLREITAHFVDLYGVGLARYKQPMAMIPTFVTDVPNGSETGTFLALDLGGTNLRVCEVKLLGDHKFDLRQKKFKVSEQLKTGAAEELFDYMALCVADFLAELAEAAGCPVENEELLHLGLTFSFPVEQTALASGTLLTWTKGFSATGAKGQDIVRLLQDGFNRKQVNVKCVALVNDTVGTLLTRAYLTGSCLLGAIFGTGTNGAYVEDLGSFKKMQGNTAAVGDGQQMIVNTEWGAFDNERKVLPLTQWDNKVDRQSINPRFQAFEKLISGMYLGEIVRNLLLYLIDLPPIPGTQPPQYFLFKGHSCKTLNTHYGLDASFMSAVEDAKSIEGVQAVIVEQLGFEPSAISAADAETVLWVCQTVGDRAAALSACAVAAVLIQAQYAKLGGAPGTKPLDSKLEIGVDGSLVEFYPHFEQRLRTALVSIVGEQANQAVKIGLAKDGSGVGAALCALVATKLEQSTAEKSTV